MQPYEIFLSPAQLYIAQEGEPAPAIDAVPAGNWVLLGTAGNRNQGEAGVTLSHNQTMVFHSTVGEIGDVKGFRTHEEDLVEVVMEDMSIEVYAKSLNMAGIREVAAASQVAGYKSMGGKMGFDVQTWALLVRVPVSSYGDGLNSQWLYPKVVDFGNKKIVLDAKGTAVGLDFKFKALADPNAASEAERFFIFSEQTAMALP